MIGHLINIETKSTCADEKKFDLISKTRLILEEMSARKEDETRILQDCQVGLTWIISLYCYIIR